MRLNALRIGANNRGTRVIERRLSTNHALNTDNVKSAINSPNSNHIKSLTDSDGKQQFIAGITPCDSSVRMGQLP